MKENQENQDQPEFKSLVVDDTTYETLYTPRFERRKPYAPPDPRFVRAVIPGVIQRIHVTAGAKVRRGAPLLVLEAMKMQNDLTAPRDSVIKAVLVKTGDMVAKGQVLLELE